MKNIAFDAPTMAACIANGEISARELLESCASQIEATDERVNAFTSMALNRAFAEADAVDARRAKGEVLGPLAGVPYAVKNLFDIEGVVTLAGSKVNRSHAAASADAFLVTQMKAAGAVLGSRGMDAAHFPVRTSGQPLPVFAFFQDQWLSCKAIIHNNLRCFMT